MPQKLFPRLLLLLIGLIFFALGVSLGLQANIGYAPWEVLHVGLAKTFGLSIGTANILTGFFLVLYAAFSGENIGIGTIANMFLIGFFIDLILQINLIPLASSLLPGLFMMIASMFTIAFGTFFYISSGFGTGPRDSLMVILTRKTHLSIGFCRSAIETTAVVIGWYLGGMVGFGTLFSALAIGYCVQITFKLLRFDPTIIEHERFQDTYHAFLRK
ncbi:MAG TPA: hypothetical protein IAB06_07990 [Candidatus Avacidaminococcus intestinavium]|uniref:Integral membrane protein n=1 Tax=Candidatus Avacidaminococcus intestinavium TaxID=2840684 RepID=A0A9D1SM37_9FIRM|nr:hypothetical protein [Candidatus Avacidaminococcus intestinavium]